MKNILIYILLLMPIAAGAQNLDVKLMNIRYYDGEGCSPENPVRVRVCFETKNCEPRQLTMVIRLHNAVTLTKEVRDFDANGNVYYSFCSKMGESSNFEIYFRDLKNHRSDNFAVFAMPDEYKIMKE